ncbi:hypothetical protein F2P56_013163 [Juglans regia]|uniref:Uncharacterized protein LOC108998142 n=2 Tax=Juglans regia TaxID=51240 RepID=A0A2I4FES9_JUGRE|nr:uncharacterized protein LOC108998142 [Juglans regia]KAF5469063.1 hypothetical protein F2P56_013163 [Juglans regia]
MTLHGFPGETNSIESFEELGRQFLTQLMASRKCRRPSVYLLTVKQLEDESLKAYLTRFNKEKMTTDQDEKIMLAALLEGVWPRSPFMAELARKTPSTLQEFMDKVDDFINAEDTLIALTTQPERRSERETKGGQRKDRDGEQKAKSDQQESRQDGNVRRHNDGYVHYLEKTKEEEPTENKWQIEKYCTYRKTRGHRTEDCYNLK